MFLEEKLICINPVTSHSPLETVKKIETRLVL